MGDRITSFEDCPNCGGKGTVERYTAYSSNMKMKDCEKCDWNMRYDFDDSNPNETVVTPIYPNLVKSAPQSHINQIEDILTEHRRGVLIAREISGPVTQAKAFSKVSSQAKQAILANYIPKSHLEPLLEEEDFEHLTAQQALPMIIRNALKQEIKEKLEL